jgi:hypothetical protein
MSPARFIRGLIVVSLLPIFLAAGQDPPADKAAPSQPATVATVMPRVRQELEHSDFRATGRLVRVGAGGDRTSYKFSLKGHWFPDGLRLLYEITDPAAARVRLLLHMSATGSTTIEVLRPGNATATKLGFEHWNDRLLDTGFSFEDLVDSQFFWKSQEVSGPVKYGARDCFVVKSKPGEQDRSHYGSVTSWIDSTILLPVHIMKMMRETGAQKDVSYVGFRHFGGVWSVSQIEVKTQGETGSSLLLIERGSAKAKLGLQDFDFGLPPTEGKE